MESKKYVEDKLQLLGVAITNETDFIAAENLKSYIFNIFVTADRNGGYCIGSISLNLFTYSIINEKLHSANIYYDVAAVTHIKNLNNYVLKVISHAFKQLK